MPELFEKLTDGQRGCLRLVARGLTSKEIAQAIGLSPLTVDTYLKKAMDRVGIPNRKGAARAFMDWEQSQQLGSPADNLANLSDQQDLPHTASAGGWYEKVMPPPLGGSVNDKGPAERSIEMLKIAAYAVILVAALTLVIAGLLQTFR